MALAAPNHKHHLMEHVVELGAAVLSMEEKAGEEVVSKTSHNILRGH